jgi:hypothetical protein
LYLRIRIGFSFDTPLNFSKPGGEVIILQMERSADTLVTRGWAGRQADRS